MCRRISSDRLKRPYTWYGENRINLHVNAKIGSGSVGKVGVAGQRDIPIEVVLDGDDGSVLYDKRDVLNKWKESFLKLFDSTKRSSVSDSHIKEPNTGTCEPILDNLITILEVKRTIFAAKNNKF